MYIKSVKVQNFRLLSNVDIIFEKGTTVIVGKNNTAKTSLMKLFSMVIKNTQLSYNDYPLDCRKKLKNALINYKNNKIKYNDLCIEIPISSLKITVDYSEEDPNQKLGYLAQFIIDIDSAITYAIILAQYSFSIEEDKLKELLLTIRNEDEVEKIFDRIFKLQIYAVNPNDEKDVLLQNNNSIEQLFPFKTITAERSLDETELSNNKPLSSLMNRIFSNESCEINGDIDKKIEDLKKFVADTNLELQDKINKKLCDIVEKTIVFGYPNAEELKLYAKSNIELEELLKNNTDLTYTTNDGDESLPSTYNGLGYKNLIKIVFIIYEYAFLIKDNEIGTIPILFIEEPEAHMHPQLQCTFTKFLNEFLESVSNINIQVIMTTHSSYVANTVPFKQIRYMKKTVLGVKCKDLNIFANTNEDIDFLQKYLSISKCDMFFADKIILIEGASEKLILSDMIDKCKDNGEFSFVEPALPSQYYSVIEVGGAYAYKFFRFIDFLETPTLIITDIDSINEKRCKEIISQATKSSNVTINYWVKNVLGLEEISDVRLKQIIELPQEKKNMGCKHIEYQVEENGVCGRSFEQAIANINRALYDLTDLSSEIDVNNVEYDKKTDFAIRLLMHSSGYKIPKYIRDGLIWLNNQKQLNEINVASNSLIEANTAKESD